MGLKDYKKKKAALQKKRQAGFVEEQEQNEKANSPQVDETILKIGKEDEDIEIRFLPQGTSDRLPRVATKRHFLINYVNGKKKNLSFKCRKTLDDSNPCPSDDKGSEMWNDNEEKFSPNNKKAATYYRKDQFFANVLVVDNPNDPATNGTVKKLPFGRTIDKMIRNKIISKKKNGKVISKGVDIFCPIDGANFILSATPEGDNNTYKNSTFMEESSPIADDDKEFDRIMNACYNLDELYLNEDTFLSEVEVQKRFDKFEGVQYSATVTTENVTSKEEVDDKFDYDETDVETAGEDLELSDADFNV